MRESGYYPPGAEYDPRAPWNQEDLPEKEFNVVCSQTLSKADTVFTNNYIPGAVDAESEWDGEGYQTVYNREPDDTSNIIWSEEWHENDHYTPIQLIGILKDYITKDLIYGDSKYSKKHLEHLLEECEGWTEDEIDYVED